MSVKRAISEKAKKAAKILVNWPKTVRKPLREPEMAEKGFFTSLLFV